MEYQNVKYPKYELLMTTCLKSFLILYLYYIIKRSKSPVFIKDLLLTTCLKSFLILYLYYIIKRSKSPVFIKDLLLTILLMLYNKNKWYIPNNDRSLYGLLVEEYNFRWRNVILPHYWWVYGRVESSYIMLRKK